MTDNSCELVIRGEEGYCPSHPDIAAGLTVAQNAALYINSTDTSWLKIVGDGETAYPIHVSGSILNKVMLPIIDFMTCGLCFDTISRRVQGIQDHVSRS
jgi:hypothetical protein